MNEFITVTAIDKHSSDTTSRSFMVANEFLFKSMVEEWQKEIPYRRYELVTQDDIDEYTDEVKQVLDELEITN